MSKHFSVAAGILAIALVVCLTSTGCRAKTDGPWFDLVTEANELRLKGDLEGALKKAEEACKIAEDLPNPLSPALLSDNQIARLQDELGNFAEEEKALTRAIGRGTSQDFIPRVADLRLQTRTKLVSLYDFTDQSKKADPLFEQINDLQNGLSIYNTKKMVPGYEALYSKAKIEHRQQTGEEWMILLRTTNTAKRQMVDDEASVREACAHIFFNLGKPDDAYREFRRAMALRATCSARTEAEGLLAQMNILSEVGRTNEAQEKADQAETMARRLCGRDEADILTQVAQFCLYHGGDKKQGQRVLERVSAVQEWALAVNDPAKVDILGKRAALCWETEPSNKDQVKALYEKAIQIVGSSDLLAAPRTQEMLHDYMAFLRTNKDQTAADKLQKQLGERQSDLKSRQEKRRTIPQETREKFWYEFEWDFVKKLRDTKQYPGMLQRYPVFRLQVDSNGVIYEPKLVSSSGEGDLDKAASKVLMSASPLKKLPDWSSNYLIMKVTFDDKLFTEAKSSMSIPSSILMEEADHPMILAPALPAHRIYWTTHPIAKGKPFEKSALKTLNTGGALLPYSGLSAAAPLEGKLAKDSIMAHEPIVADDVAPETKK